MQIFRCPACGQPLYFHNRACACGEEVAFDPDLQEMVAGGPFCTNRDAIACNWRAPADPLCRACEMTKTVPDLATGDNSEHWARTESAKRWVIANLARWNWFGPADAGARPRFHLLSHETAAGEATVVMGHADGTITIDVSEASEPVRIQRREELGERFRTMTGHIRHEMAHFLFLRLEDDPCFLDAFRALFGDERADYAAALERHYAAAADPGEAFITSYATAHPHEDWAETVAHLLHLVDLLDSVAAAGLALPDGPAPGYDAYAEADTGQLVTLAAEHALAVNHVNRSLDLPDLYPFVLSPEVRQKLAFVHQHLRAAP